MAADRDDGEREDRRFFRDLGASYAALLVGGMMAILVLVIVLVIVVA